MADGNAAREIDRADQEIDAFIERRETCLDNEAANERAAEWARSQRRYRARLTDSRRQEWLEFHRRQALLFEALAAEHRDALGRLIDGSSARGGGR